MYKKPLLYANKDKLEAIAHLPQCGDHRPIMVKFLALYYTGILARTSEASPSVSKGCPQKMNYFGIADNVC